MICLDTNAAIAVINERPPIVGQRFEQALNDGSPIGLPVIALYEMQYGIAKSQRVEANMALLNAFLSLSIVVLPFEPDDAAEAVEIRASLERIGRPIGPYDVLIAAQARRRGAMLVTANESEFARVPGLRTEDWSQPIG